MANDENRMIIDMREDLEIFHIPQERWEDCVYLLLFEGVPPLDVHGQPLKMFEGMIIEFYGTPAPNPPAENPEGRYFWPNPDNAIAGTTIPPGIIEVWGIKLTSFDGNVTGLRFSPPGEPMTFGLLWPSTGVLQAEIDRVRDALNHLGQIKHRGGLTARGDAERERQYRRVAAKARHLVEEYARLPQEDLADNLHMTQEDLADNLHISVRTLQRRISWRWKTWGEFLASLSQ